MKSRTKIFTALAAILICFSFTNNAIAQHKKYKVKQHVKKHHKRHFRPSQAKPVAHYKYSYRGKRGKVVRKVGVGFTGIPFRGVHFRFHRGVWYKPRGKRFVVIAAPLSIRVRVLPIGYKKIRVGARPYYYYYGTYYQKAENSDEYEVVAAPVNAEVDALPKGYKIVKVRGLEYYKLDNVYYEPKITDNDERFYVVVNDPTK